MKMVDGWLDVAVEIDYLNKSMSRQGYAPKYIVLHGTAGGSSAQAIGNYFASDSSPLRYISVPLNTEKQTMR